MGSKEVQDNYNGIDRGKLTQATKDFEETVKASAKKREAVQGDESAETAASLEELKHQLIVKAKELHALVLAWNKYYVNSPRYREMLEKMYDNPEQELEERKKILDLPRDIEGGGATRYDYEGNEQHKIFLGGDVMMADDSRFSADLVMAHEIDHSLNSGNTIKGSTGKMGGIKGLNRKEYAYLLSRNKYNKKPDGSYIFDPSQINEHTDLKTSTDPDGYLSFGQYTTSDGEKVNLNRSHTYGIPEEVSDLSTFRFALYKKEIFDAGTEIFTKETLEKARANKVLSEDYVIQRFLDRFSSDEDLIEVMNTIAYIPNVDNDQQQFMA